MNKSFFSPSASVCCCSVIVVWKIAAGKVLLAGDGGQGGPALSQI